MSEQCVHQPVPDVSQSECDLCGGQMFNYDAPDTLCSDCR